MTTRAEQFAGLSVAITTPFLEGKVDYDKLAEQIEFQIAAGTECICPVGTTGESPTMSHTEHEEVITETVKMASGRIKVMPGTGSNATSEALRLTKHAEQAGADGALVVAPYYNKPTQEGFFQHYKSLAESTSLPICVYNIPGRTGKNIEPETIIRMAEACPNIAMVKEATGSLDQASAVICATDITVLSGDDSLTLPLMAVGARGIVSVVGNIVPKDIQAVVRSYEAGKQAEALALHQKLFPLCRDMLSLATNPIPIKTAMKMLGRDNGQMRLPMTPLDANQEAQLRKTLTNYGLL